MNKKIGPKLKIKKVEMFSNGMIFVLDSEGRITVINKDLEKNDG